jgi:hypothetical protein
VQMFRSKKANTEWLNPNAWMDWKDAGHKVEATGRKLDAIRKLLSSKAIKEGSWAHTHWTQQEQIMLRRWKLMVSLHQSGLRQAGAHHEHIKISYDWLEYDAYSMPSLPIFSWIESKMDDMFYNLRRQDGLHRAWERARNEFIQKARQGLV